MERFEINIQLSFDEYFVYSDYCQRFVLNPGLSSDETGQAVAEQFIRAIMQIKEDGYGDDDSIYTLRIPDQFTMLSSSFVGGLMRTILQTFASWSDEKLYTHILFASVHECVLDDIREQWDVLSKDC